jgi:hypothetical protein
MKLEYIKDEAVIEQEVHEQANDWKSRLDRFKIDLEEEIEPPRKIWTTNVNGKEYILGTNGDFSVITGKAKSKKSFYLNLILTDYLKNSKSTGTILYFDTEQGKYHFRNSVKKIANKVGGLPPHFEAYHLRTIEPAQRLKVIEECIQNTPDVELVIIDGLRDLITAINDEEQATSLTSKFLKWTEEKDMHLITVLHQNKTDTNLRGHIGTEAQNKAQTVLSVTRCSQNKNVSIVEAVFMRDEEPDAFAFEIDENGYPIMIDDYKKSTPPTRNRKPQPEEITIEQYEAILTESFKNNEELKYKDLTMQIELAIKKILAVDIGKMAVQKVITYLGNENLIVKHGKERSPKAYYTFNNGI